MKKLLMLITMCVSVWVAYAHEVPANNLGKNLNTMRIQFPDLRYLYTDSDGDRYQDGYSDDGVAIYFLLQDNAVIEECMICDSSDGFSLMWFNELWKSFSTKYPFAVRVNKPYSKIFDFGTFKLLIKFSSEDGTNRTTILYSL